MRPNNENHDGFEAAAPEAAASDPVVKEPSMEGEEPAAGRRPAKPAARPTLDVVFKRGEGVVQRLPSRRVMTHWMLSALDRPAEISVRFASVEEASDLNKTYRGKDGPTNVLTFDYQHEPVVEADIVICLDVVEREAREQFKRFQAHLAHLLIHGVLHAQGWDHETDEQAEKMEAREAEIMLSLGFENPYYDVAQRH